MFARLLDGLRRRIATHWRVIALAAVATAAAAGLWLAIDHRGSLERRLLATPADEVASHKDLVRFASGEAKPLYARYCAQCHGENLTGPRAEGAPNLADKTWLYGDSVYRIERDILYGLRSGMHKANDLSEMPAYGLRGQLSDADIKNVVQYVLQFSGRPADAEAAQTGGEIYEGRAACTDCHSGDGRGNIDYGATDFTANVWDYGGDPQSLYNSIYFGRHGVMPGWIGKLSLTQIRALAVYVHSASKP